MLRVFPWERSTNPISEKQKGNTAHRYLKTSWIHYKNLSIYTPQICKVCVCACMKMLQDQKPLASASKQETTTSKYVRKGTEHSQRTKASSGTSCWSLPRHSLKGLGKSYLQRHLILWFLQSPNLCMIQILCSASHPWKKDGEDENN